MLDWKASEDMVNILKEAIQLVLGCTTKFDEYSINNDIINQRFTSSLCRNARDITATAKNTTALVNDTESVL